MAICGNDSARSWASSRPANCDSSNSTCSMAKAATLDAYPDASERTPRRAGNLPTPLSSFVGRTDEIREIGELLSTTRLVSLLSFGGVGKTRLAIEVAAHLSDQFDDGVWFVDLVPSPTASCWPTRSSPASGLPATVNRDPDDYLLSRTVDTERVDRRRQLRAPRRRRGRPRRASRPRRSQRSGAGDEPVAAGCAGRGDLARPTAHSRHRRRSSCSHNELGSCGPGSWSTTRTVP